MDASRPPPAWRAAETRSSRLVCRALLWTAADGAAGDAVVVVAVVAAVVVDVVDSQVVPLSPPRPRP